MSGCGLQGDAVVDGWLKSHSEVDIVHWEANESMLTAFWFRTSKGLGYGVTAFSQEDAEELLRSFGYLRDGETLKAIEKGVAHTQLDQDHVVPNMGPIVVRGVWYPNHSSSC
jgi:hypothetical protein